ncbi:MULTISPECIES: RNA polymerase sigma factor [unclassified Streptomyces]|uniref:RNA polymerase sigma factor n=1 Tax=unclassified Streptomyces TaxID=2593676 RepID=UPI000AA08209|nr:MULTISPECIES: sigma factor-like helix-turn-helix DNA-binding protein [unclassified Streptomyces]
MLRYVEDRPDDEIAAILGVAQGTVRSQTHKALTSLRTTLPEAGPPASSTTSTVPVWPAWPTARCGPPDVGSGWRAPGSA